MRILLARSWLVLFLQAFLKDPRRPSGSISPRLDFREHIEALRGRVEKFRSLSCLYLQERDTQKPFFLYVQSLGPHLRSV